MGIISERERLIRCKIKKAFYYSNKDKPYWTDFEKKKEWTKNYALNNKDKIVETNRRTWVYQKMVGKLTKLGYAFVKDERRIWYRMILDKQGKTLINIPSIYTMEDFDVFISKIYEMVEEQKRFEEYGKLLGFDSVNN